MFNDIKDSPQSISDKEENKGENKEPNPPTMPKTAPPPPPGPDTIDDIFAETEKIEKPEIFKSKVGIGEPGEAAVDASKERPAGKFRKIFMFVIIIVGGLLVGSGGYLGYNVLISKFSSDLEAGKEVEEQTENAGIIDQESGGVVVDKNNQDNVVPGEQVMDSDQDGLSDEEEKALGTDINNPDTDGDGLFDREEVKVYKTNPLIRDSDGDGFLDGAEVKGGYDPNGPGKLYEIE